MGIRIVSDGSVYGGTKVYSSSGEELKHVRSITWTHKAGEAPRATIEFLEVQVDVSGLETATGQVIPVELAAHKPKAE